MDATADMAALNLAGSSGTKQVKDHPFSIEACEEFAIENMPVLLTMSRKNKTAYTMLIAWDAIGELAPSRHMDAVQKWQEAAARERIWDQDYSDDKALQELMPDLHNAVAGPMQGTELSVKRCRPLGYGEGPSVSDIKGQTVLQLGYGNLKLDALPKELEGYLKGSIAKRVTQDNPDSEKVIITVVPPRIDGAAVPGGHSVWLTKSSTKSRLFKIPGFPKPPPKISKIKYVVKPTSNEMGLGVFATEEIKRSETFLVERPLIVSPHQLISGSSVPKEAIKDLTPGQLSQFTLKAAEKPYEHIVYNTMTVTESVAFMALANSHKHDGSGPLVGIVRTNAIGVMFHDEVIDNDFGGYGVVAEVGSRFNHSCISDIDSIFDPKSFTIQFKALRDIKAGSQIFLSYVQGCQSKASRQASLAPYGITECKCRVCINSTPQTDKLRKVSLNLSQMWMKQCDNVWLKDPKLTVKVLDPLLETKRRMEDEGIDVNQMGYYIICGVILQVYRKLGMRKEASKYADLVRQGLKMARGV